jgi:hypothetical protein
MHIGDCSVAQCVDRVVQQRELLLAPLQAREHIRRRKAKAQTGQSLQCLRQLQAIDHVVRGDRLGGLGSRRVDGPERRDVAELVDVRVVPELVQFALEEIAQQSTERLTLTDALEQ